MPVGRAGMCGCRWLFCRSGARLRHFPGGPRGRERRGGGRRGAGPVAASVQVAHTKRTSSLVWRHMIKIFSPSPLPEAIYCFSASSPLGQRARRCSRPRDAPALTGGSGECGQRACPAVALGGRGDKALSTCASEPPHRVEHF